MDVSKRDRCHIQNARTPCVPLKGLFDMSRSISARTDSVRTGNGKPYCEDGVKSAMEEGAHTKSHQTCLGQRKNFHGPRTNLEVLREGGVVVFDPAALRVLANMILKKYDA